MWDKNNSQIRIMYSILIKNATVMDGTGTPGFFGDVAIQGDQIVNIAPQIKTAARSVIDATGLVLAPGFIDLQNHSDAYWQIFDNPSLDSLITQGYTTILMGNCGASLAPLLSPDALLAFQKWHNLDGVNINWVSFSEFIEQLSKRRFACNVGSLVGYSTLRRAIVGDQIRGLQKGELEALVSALEESLEAGAFGLSSGLSYAHEIIVSELELFELAKVVKKHSALLSIHLRNEGDEIIEALDEALDIAKATAVNLKISHLKIRNESNWHKLPEVLNLLGSAYMQGGNVHYDLYPYDTVWQALYSYLPKWAIEGGRATMLRHFADPAQKNKVLSFLNNSGVKFSSMYVASTASKLNFAGKTVSQIAKNLESSGEQAVLKLVENGGSEVLVFEKNLDINQVKELALYPLSLIGTDGGGFGINNPRRLVHPRCFGTAPKFLNLAAEAGLELEIAIKKLTSGPAKKAGIKKRGEIKIGNFADLVVFNPAKLRDRATYENPYQFSEGMEHVFVNGKAVITVSEISGQLPGYALRKGN